MIKHIKIKVYLALKDSEWELSAGATGLTGPNNSGDSVLL